MLNGEGNVSYTLGHLKLEAPPHHLTVAVTLPVRHIS